MIQDIKPHIYNNNFTPREPMDTDYVFIFEKNQALVIEKNEEMCIPTYEMIQSLFPELSAKLTYLFTIDDHACFAYIHAVSEDLSALTKVDGAKFVTDRTFRTFEPKWLAFAGITAGHLNKWYQRNQFCGRCGKPMIPSKKERAMTCPSCGFIDYPKICPAIIVGVTDGDKIMMTKYANRSFKRYALIAGFCEIGETLEDTVRREVMEEVGVKVKNIRYFNNQPWGFSESLLVGFFAELDGDAKVTMDTGELAEAVWMNREDIPVDTENELSLTYLMMKAFRENSIN